MLAAVSTARRAVPSSHSLANLSGPGLKKWAVPVVYLALAVGCAFTAYWAMYSQWAYYDDSGFFEYSIQLFLHGHTLYSHDFSDYGPFYYELWGGLFKLLGNKITTDRGSAVQIVLWLTCTFGIGLGVHRLTHRFALGLIALTTCFPLLGYLTAEPMQADSLVCGLTVAVFVCAAFGLERRPRASCVAIGALTAALLLTKVNAGAYAMIAVGFAAIMTFPQLRHRRWLRALASIAFVAVGPAVMLKTFSAEWTQYFIVLTLASTIALVFVVDPDSPEAGDENWSASWLISGFVATVVVVVGIIFALGTSPGAMWNAIVVLPTHQTAFLIEPIPQADNYVTWSVLLAAGAWLAGRTRRSDSDRPAVLWGALRVLTGIAVLSSLIYEFPFDLSASTDSVFALAMPLAWVVAVPPAQVASTMSMRFVRVLLPALAVESILAAYPVAGTQTMTGSVLFVACGALCLADGWVELTAWWAARTPSQRAGPGLSQVLGAAFAALAIVMVFEHVIEPAQSWSLTYDEGVQLEVNGGDHLRIDALQATAINDLVYTARMRCRTLWSIPGQYSFNLWTELPTPTSFTGAQPFWLSLTAAQQSQALAAAKASKKLCIIENTNGLLDDYGGGPPPLTIPLVAFMENDVHLLGQYGTYQLEAVGKPPPPPRRRHRKH
jgi:hypothetical protein